MATIASIQQAAQGLPATPSAASVHLSAVLLFAGGLCLWPLLLRALHFASPGRCVYFVSWGFSRVVLAALAAVLFSLAAGYLLPEGSLFGHGPFLFALLAASAAAVHASFLAQREPFTALGLAAPKAGALVAALCGVLVGLPLIVGLAWLWPGFESQLAGWFGATPPSASASLGAPSVAYLAVALFVSAPLQELLIRGFLQPLFVQNFSERGGLLLSGLVFATLHGGAGFPALWALGLILAEIKLRTHSTWASLLGHGLYLLVAAAFAEFTSSTALLLPFTL